MKTEGSVMDDPGKHSAHSMHCGIEWIATSSFWPKRIIRQSRFFTTHMIKFKFYCFHFSALGDTVMGCSVPWSRYDSPLNLILHRVNFYKTEKSHHKSHFQGWDNSLFAQLSRDSQKLIITNDKEKWYVTPAIQRQENRRILNQISGRSFQVK